MLRRSWKRFCPRNFRQEIFNLAIGKQELVVFQFAPGYKRFDKTLLRPGMQCAAFVFLRCEVAPYSSGSRRRALTFRQLRQSTVKRAGDIGIPVNAANVEDSHPSECGGF